MDIRQVMQGRATEPQNLVNPSKVDGVDFVTKPPKSHGPLVLGVLGILAAFLTGYAYERYLTIGLTPWLMVAALLFFFVFSLLQVFFVAKFSGRSGFLVLEAIAMASPFFRSPHEEVLAAVGVLFLFLLWGYAESRAELNYGMEIRFFKVTHGVAAKLMTGILLFVIFFFVVVRGVGGSFFVSENTFTGFFEGGAAIFTDFYPTVFTSGSFEEFAESVTREELSGNAAFVSLSPAGQSAAVQEGAAALTGNFSRALGVTITPTSTTSGVMYDFILGLLENWHDRFGIWFVVGWAFVLFVILRSLGVAFILVAQFFAMIFYELLLAVGLVHVIDHPQTKEVVEFT